MGRVLASSLDFEEVLERVSQVAMDLLDLDGAGVWTHEDRLATVRTSTGKTLVPVGTTWSLSDAVTEVVMVNGEPYYIEASLLRTTFRTSSGVSFRPEAPS